MATLVSTGQITIVDNNDAKSLSSFITANGPTQQIYTKDDNVVTYTPDWSATNLILTAKVYVAGNASDIASTLTNKKWYTSASATSLGATNTLTINSNVLAPATPSLVYFFEGDYTDTVTNLTSHVIAQISISQVTTGTNAVFIRVDGKTVIEPTTGQTKNTTTVIANLMRAGGVDDTGTLYQWFVSPFATADQIDGNYTNVTSKYGFLDTAATANNVVGTVGVVKTTSAGTSTAITTTNVPDAGWVDLKSLVIDETAVTNIAYFRVKAKDAAGTIYQADFSVYDVSDKYTTEVSSSTGDKLQNGVGSTTLTPIPYYGSTKVADLTGWSFLWKFFDRNGNQGAFVDTAKIATAGGALIGPNTAGIGAQITYGGTSYNFVAGDIIKCVNTSGTAYFYEVASSTTNVVTIRTPSTNTFLNFTNYPAPASGDFTNGKLYGCVATRTTSTASTVSITLTGDEVDAKARITVDSSKPI